MDDLVGLSHTRGKTTNGVFYSNARYMRAPLDKEFCERDCIICEQCPLWSALIPMQPTAAEVSTWRMCNKRVPFIVENVQNVALIVFAWRFCWQQIAAHCKPPLCRECIANRAAELTCDKYSFHAFPL